MKKYRAIMGTPTVYEDGKDAPMRMHELCVDELGVDEILSVELAESIETRVDELLGSPGYLWDESSEEYTQLEDSCALRKVKGQYLSAIISLTLGTLRSEGFVLLNLKTLTITCEHESTEDPFYSFELVEG